MTSVYKLALLQFCGTIVKIFLAILILYVSQKYLWFEFNSPCKMFTKSKVNIICTKNKRYSEN